MTGRPISPAGDPLSEARQAHHRRDWVAAREAFLAARAEGALGADDLFALAECAWWLGAPDEALPVHEAAFRLYLAEGNPRRAALVALDTGYTHALRGDEAQASGWMSRAIRLLQDQPPCAEHGYLVHLQFEEALVAADLDTALDRARAVHAAGERFGDPNLLALGVLGQGRVLVKQGRVREGMALLDEAMVAAISDDLEPGWAGNIYCHLMVACDEVADLRRAGEWTEATARWCETMPGAGPFMGICRVHRAQTLHVLGAWEDAEREVVRVCDEFAHFHVAIVAEAHYQLGELRRQRNDLAGAEAAFRDARRLGRDPQPGFALLRLAQGRLSDAASAVQLALAAQAADPLGRARLLPAAVEIDIAAGELGRAGQAVDELAGIARAFGTTALRAAADHAAGSVLLATGDAAGALPALRQALQAWQSLPAPYEGARSGALLARVYDELGDRDAARLELEAARAALASLGVAVPPESSEATPAHAGRGGLTAREAEVLDLVVAGLTNQDIASELVLSVRTVERHLATVYRKLGLQGRNARAAAVAWALRHDPAPTAGAAST